MIVNQMNYSSRASQPATTCLQDMTTQHPWQYTVENTYLCCAKVETVVSKANLCGPLTKQLKANPGGTILNGTDGITDQCLETGSYPKDMEAASTVLLFVSVVGRKVV